MVKVDKNKCTGCETCVEACPVEAIKMVDEKAEVNRDECVECGTCIETCPQEAIKEE